MTRQTEKIVPLEAALTKIPPPSRMDYRDYMRIDLDEYLGVFGRMVHDDQTILNYVRFLDPEFVCEKLRGSAHNGVLSDKDSRLSFFRSIFGLNDHNTWNIAYEKEEERFRDWFGETILKGYDHTIRHDLPKHLWYSEESQTPSNEWYSDFTRLRYSGIGIGYSNNEDGLIRDGLAVFSIYFDGKKVPKGIPTQEFPFGTEFALPQFLEMKRIIDCIRANQDITAFEIHPGDGVFIRPTLSRVKT